MFLSKERPKLYIPTRVMEIADIIIGSVRDDSKYDAISENQVNAITRVGNHSIILKGFPGTGKTFTGVERIIIRQANKYVQGSKDTYSLIVSLNDQLAKSIENELFNNHIESQFLVRFSDADKKRILKSVHVKSLQGVLEDWAPDFSQNGTNWLITNADLRKMFDTLQDTKNINVRLEDLENSSSNI